MDVQMIFKIAAIGIVVAVLNQLLKNAQREEMATMVTLTGVVVVLMMVISMIADLFNAIQTMFQLY
ncbi:stage III sporulation protein AC [Alkalibaculum sp. M08DMB]|uniref:Stage III sporulation protein AC n=1 Tax=Alkalibaculum sporogenes TaxID=2655001 RepID=A0A6A7K6Q4_9FIRM|nr:stage III sporulation protein AC [Alkalibaculum sporogenes]MPW25138.1 stage III sporulation protein AC [Alkalibaculum sporogenes]